jgi:hypothetical protein
MQEAAELSNYLPLSFMTRSEQDYIAFLWNAFETKCTRQSLGELGARPEEDTDSVGGDFHIARENYDNQLDKQEKVTRPSELQCMRHAPYWNQYIMLSCLSRKWSFPQFGLALT